MRKTTDLCDVCGRDIHENNGSLEHFKSGGSFMYRHAGNSANDFEQLDLCWKCKELLAYLMENQEVLRQSCMRMSLGNRVRLLFKKPLKG
jgi:hypothetical protein